METDKKGANLFVVLVPHRDTRLILQDYGSALFKAGFEGAFNFPWVCPLAAISKPFSKEELKHCAHSLKSSAAEGKFSAAEGLSFAFPSQENNTMLFGPRLNFEITPALFGDAAEKIKSIFPAPILGTCLQPLAEIAESAAQFPPPPQLSFRAAAVANMSYYQFESTNNATVYKWKIGKLSWLPKQTRLPRK